MAPPIEALFLKKTESAIFNLPKTTFPYFGSAS